MYRSWTSSSIMRHIWSKPLYWKNYWLIGWFGKRLCLTKIHRWTWINLVSKYSKQSIKIYKYNLFSFFFYQIFYQILHDLIESTMFYSIWQWLGTGSGHITAHPCSRPHSPALQSLHKPTHHLKHLCRSDRTHQPDAAARSSQSRNAVAAA